MRFAEITDGLSNTLLVGEKHVRMGTFGVNVEGDGSFYNGDYWYNACRPAGAQWPLAPSPSAPGRRLTFGSWHPGICQFVFCDGRVQALPVSLSPRVLGLLADRNDGQVIPAY